MKKLLVAAAFLGAGAGLTSVATAATTVTTNGKLTAFAYSSSTKTGKVTVVSSGGTYVYKVSSKTDCGFSQGQMGDQIACKSLGATRYARKSVTVRWHRDSRNARVAELVAVHLK